MKEINLEVFTSHEVEALRAILSDPQFVLSRVFKSIKEVNVDKNSFKARAVYLGLSHHINGNVYTSLDEVSYVFILKKGENAGSGKLTFSLSPGKIVINMKYEGWMGFFSSSILKSWLTNFTKNLDEEVRLERIRRKI